MEKEEEKEESDDDMVSQRQNHERVHKTDARSLFRASDCSIKNCAPVFRRGIYDLGTFHLYVAQKIERSCTKRTCQGSAVRGGRNVGNGAKEVNETVTIASQGLHRGA